MKVSHDFNWTKAYKISLEEAREFRLVKGVAMTEGEAKRGELMTEENLRYATGAMAASALLGYAALDIDHWAESIPSQKELTEMSLDYNYSIYDVEKINAEYPVGYIVDCALSKNKVGVDGEELWQVEFIAFMSNDYVYEMIKKNQFKACSVVDYPREYSCDSCNAETGECTCSVEGSKFLLNTLILEAVPNSHSTWISAIDENDIGSIVKPNGTNQHAIHTNKIKTLIEFCKSNRHAIDVADIDKYMTNGKWNDGVESVKEFLINEKNIPADKVNEIAQFIFDNPALLNKEQLTYLSGADILSWYDNKNIINNKSFHNFLQKLGEKKPSSKKTHSTLLTQEEAAYGEQEEETTCSNCRWSNFAEDPSTEESEGSCQLVEGTIMGGMGCSRFESLEGNAEEETEEETETEESTENTTEEEETEENTTTESTTEESTDSTAENTAKEEQKEIDDLEKKANTTPKKKTHAKATVNIISNDKAQAILSGLDSSIALLKEKQQKIGAIIGFSTDSMKKQGEYHSIQKQIHDLEEQKKS